MSRQIYFANSKKNLKKNKQKLFSVIVLHSVHMRAEKRQRSFNTRQTLLVCLSFRYAENAGHPITYRLTCNMYIN